MWRANARYLVWCCVVARLLVLYSTRYRLDAVANEVRHVNQSTYDMLNIVPQRIVIDFRNLHIQYTVGEGE